MGIRCKAPNTLQKAEWADIMCTKMQNRQQKQPSTHTHTIAELNSVSRVVNYLPVKKEN